jgi:hypothetical protein
MITLAKAERAIRRLYRAGDSLPTYERFSFSDPMEDVLTRTVSSQERWITKTEAFLPKAPRRIKTQEKKKNHPIKKVRIAPLELLVGKLVDLFPFTFSPSLRSRVVGALRRIRCLSRFFHFDSRGRSDSRRRVVFIQKKRSPAFRAAGVIVAVTF